MSIYIKGKCSCGNNQESKGRLKGKQIFSKYCSSCKRKHYEINKTFKKGFKCSNCGFEAKHPSQLDIDHIDGNHNNNNISNLQVLCANCHRLKTQQNEDWKISLTI